ncbi:MAG: redox-regulated ATPase YchF [Lactobacillales bacterium]|jgi:GTP-binding protein YchF|nr:redox-regulated ATPase YchF [Lactobacillales bacterium]
MGFNCGIVGLPNVGKSTLFNALTSTANAQAANYPFCTIEPNVGRVAVPDARMDVLQKIDNSQKQVPTQLEFVDIAGLVRGASKGEGLGNQFLANIREVDAIIHVLRCFENSDVVHVEGSVDPVRDAATVETELMLADLDSLEKRIAPIQKKAQTGDKESKQLVAVMAPALKVLQDGKPARLARPMDPEQAKLFDQMYLLTSKPVLYVCNVEESAAGTGNVYSEKVAEMAKLQGNSSVVISANIEAEVAQLSSKEEQQEFLQSLGLAETGLNRIIKAGYKLLELETFFTTGPKETHAWTMKKGTLAPGAAGVIHTDFEKGFIRAEVIAYDDYVKFGGESGARENGKLRQEGKTYVMKDGDVVHFLFNV